jgi:Staphylococcal nuclease homologue
LVLMARLALMILLFLMPAAWGLPDEAAGRVVSVVSGDSLGIEMLISDPRTNEIDSIKLADIDAPSTVTAEGKAAKAYVATLLKNKTVFLDIEDNISRCRSQWGQLICLVYLRDESGQPLWPPVNRIMVDEGYALLDDDAGNEFNASAWWGQPSLPLSGEKSDQLNAMLEKSPSAKLPEESNEVSILKKSSTSGAYVIGYHNR